MTQSKVKVRLAGALMCGIGVWLVINEWQSALTSAVYHPKVSFIAPVFAFLGAMLLLYPVTKEEMRERYGSDQLRWIHMNRPQKTLTVLACVAGLLNILLISGTLKL